MDAQGTPSAGVRRATPRPVRSHSFMGADVCSAVRLWAVEAGLVDIHAVPAIRQEPSRCGLSSSPLDTATLRSAAPEDREAENHSREFREGIECWGPGAYLRLTPRSAMPGMPSGTVLALEAFANVPKCRHHFLVRKTLHRRKQIRNRMPLVSPAENPDMLLFLSQYAV
ncbi:hypothetical protein OE88DRAFT_283961 [Heliocybe sulcata]|uniref:Uncharacterized protein n=1 Tax=Heliocybe sulcata TaxID=5364 RepID=A0A5C3N0U8_9AGAM|nr:hypothetical protein OE88DRAFT_283961 [Heliocybe sulcata]